jgi:hypothetical protein
LLHELEKLSELLARESSSKANARESNSSSVLVCIRSLSQFASSVFQQNQELRISPVAQKSDSIVDHLFHFVSHSFRILSIFANVVIFSSCQRRSTRSFLRPDQRPDLLARVVDKFKKYTTINTKSAPVHIWRNKMFSLVCGSCIRIRFKSDSPTSRLSTIGCTTHPPPIFLLTRSNDDVCRISRVDK